MVPLEYEHLDLHCTNCFALTHSSSQCPLLEPHISLATASHPRAAAESSHREALPAAPQPFNQRVDRHRRPFGDRVQPAARGNPLRNKLTPDLPHSARRNLEPVTRRRHDSPPHIRSERQHQSPRDARPQQYWREKVQQREPGPPPPSLRSPPLETERGPLQRNLALSESSMFPPLPSQEAVLEELQEVTLQYTNCKDPTESAARRHRVLQGEMNGLMAKRLLPS